MALVVADEPAENQMPIARLSRRIAVDPSIVLRRVTAKTRLLPQKGAAASVHAIVSQTLPSCSN